MILIDLNKKVQNIVLTLSELSTENDTNYILVLTNEFTKNILAVDLGTNYSLNLNRYDFFKIESGLLNGLEAGNYSYKVYQSSGETTETGKAKVIAFSGIDKPIIYKSDKPNDFITYKK